MPTNNPTVARLRDPGHTKEGGGVAAPDPAAADMARAQLRMLRFLADDPASRPSIRTAARRELADLQKHHGADLVACAAAEGR